MQVWAVLLCSLTIALTCKTDHDCSLNGVCSVGDCICDRPWTGESCGVTVRVPARTVGIYGVLPNVSSWGGVPVRGDDGNMHLFVAEMKEGGLSGWSRESECTHAIAGDVAGPYTKADVAIPVWCHNPSAIRDPSGEWLLFHIGDGGHAGASTFMHHATSPAGPWTSAPTSPAKCNNPAPAFHPNGTLYVVCNHLQITYARTWRDEWAPLRSLGNPGGDRDRHWEDPFLWFDRRGHWHIMYHVYCLKPYAYHKECTSGHAYSPDGLKWTFSPVEPYNGTVFFTDSPPITFSTRERPKLIFADANKTTPVGVVTGVSPQPVGPQCDTCKQQACSQCKVTKGRDWTFTQLQPFLGFTSAFGAVQTEQ